MALSNQLISTYITAADKKKLIKAAKAQGLTVSGLVRQLMYNHFESIKVAKSCKKG